MQSIRADTEEELYKAFLEIMAVRRRSPVRPNVHVDQAIAAVRIIAREQNGVSVSDQTNVWQIRIGVRVDYLRRALRVIRRQRRDRLMIYRLLIHALDLFFLPLPSSERHFCTVSRAKSLYRRGECPNRFVNFCRSPAFANKVSHSPNETEMSCQRKTDAAQRERLFHPSRQKNVFPYYSGRQASASTPSASPGSRHGTSRAFQLRPASSDLNTPRLLAA
jgi:hypothetical protein